jgi:hypothetical protein
MPVLPRDDISLVPDNLDAADGSDIRIWVTVAVTAGIFLVVAAFVAGIVIYSRRQEYRKARRQNPYLSHKEFLRRKNMSAAARQKEEELQRQIMIRKSLASKSSDWSTHSDNRSLIIQETTEVGLKEDWKAWEARMERERSELAYRHPSSTGLPDLPIPVHSRSMSPSCDPLLRGQSPRSSSPHASAGRLPY